MLSYEIELLNPNKTEVLPFLSGEFAAEPKRYARATVAFGIPDPPYYQEYMVGPLPATNVTKLQPLTYPFNNEEPGKTKVPPLTLPGQDVSSFILAFGADVEDITQELWNTVSPYTYNLTRRDRADNTTSSRSRKEV